MGYCIQVISSEVKINKKDFDDCLKAIQSLKGKEPYGDHFSWVPFDFHTIDNLEKMLEEWRWHPRKDETGNIIDLEFTGEKYGDDNLLFEKIAPYIEGGGYIEFVGEDGSRWKLDFQNGEMKEKHAKIEYDN